MSGRRKIDPYLLIVTMVVIALLGLGSFLGYAFVSQRAAAVAKAQSDLVYVTALVAQGFEGALRAADVMLQRAADRLASARGPGERGRILVDAALFLPEASNVYLLGPDGRLLATALHRNDAALPLGAEALERLRDGAGLQVLVLDAPAEGGSVVAFMRGLEIEGRFAGCVAALFAEPMLKDLDSGLLGESIERLELRDAEGGTLRRVYRGPDSAAPEPSFRAEWSLHAYPLRVVASRDIADALMVWRRSILPPLILSGAFIAFVAVALAYGFLLDRKARRAERLSIELDAKDALFHEVNHRVKNNLAIVRSLLSLGARELEVRPGAGVEILRASVDRVGSIEMLHEQLYRRTSLATTDFGAYVRELAAAIGRSYDTGQPIEVAVEADDGILISLNSAMPCALILNELVTNAYKYAFPGGRGGRIRVSARRLPAGALELVVSDDGVGMQARTWAEEEDAEPPQVEGSHLGFTLVRMLAAQVDAAVDFRSEPGKGSTWSLVVPIQDEGGAAHP